ncbi:ankyrin repeat domain-containing protein [Bremerella volcania]|nr:ankyrin repeat domain-containing protein [Bremerella volcania]
MQAFFFGCQEKQPVSFPKPVQTLLKPKTVRHTIAQSEGWQPKDFFQAEESRRICEAISAGDQVTLERLLKQSPDVNVTGKYGLTLLHWAFAEENMGAFQTLLKNGANPDLKLSENVPHKIYDVTFVEDSNIFFSSIQCLRPAYCTAALPYSDDPKQPILGGSSMLHLILSRMPCPANEEDIDAMLKHGIEVNTQGAFGYTPCHWAVHNAPRLCVPLLEAGADPSIQDEKGRDVADAVDFQIAEAQKLGRNIQEYEPVIEWLSENYRPIDTQRPSGNAP